MKTRRQIKLPYEKAGEKWKEYTRPFKATLHQALSLKEREQWVHAKELSDFRVFACGCYTQAWGHYWKRRHLEEGVYIYCVAGKGYYKQGVKTWDIKPGELLYCPPDTQHEYGADPTEPWTIYWLHVSGPRISVFKNHLAITRECPVIHVGIVPGIVELFRLLFSFFTTASNDTNKLAIQSCTAALLSALAVAAHSSRTVHAYTQEVNAALAFMEGSVLLPLDVASMARHAEVSTFHFCRIFKKATGLSPMQYFNHLKIRKACSLLAGSTLKIKEIAFQLGFEDAHYFSRLFKKIMGFSPEQYRHKP
jgi:AraC-like DNA-binding protein/mannose-6-phosphate isomerase-like protein (cupin superfamily)